MDSPEDTPPDAEGSGRAAGSNTYELTREELRTTFEYQVQRLREIDEKAIEILRANLLLLGLVVTGGSILVQTEVDLAPFINLFTLTGLTLLLVSTGLAGTTYTISNLRGGLDADAVEDAIVAHRGSDSEAAAFEDRLLRSYGRWIEYNARVTAVNDALASVTVLTVIVAFVYVAAGIPVGALSPSFPLLIGSFLALSVVLVAITRSIYQMDGMTPPESATAGPYAGVQLSKGGSREEGWRGFREMLREPPENPTHESDDRD